MGPAVQEPNELFREGALASLLRLQWFIHLRTGMVGGALAVLALERVTAPEVHRPVGLITTVVITGLINVGWLLLSRWVSRDLRQGVDAQGLAMRRGRQFANAQVAVDLLLLTVVLRYAGGLESVLAIFYLFHMGIGALLLRPGQAMFQGAWAVALYAGLGVGELLGWIKPHYALLPALPSAGLYHQPSYVFLAIFVQAAAVFGTLYFTLRIAQRFGAQEAQLRRALHALRSSREAIKELQDRRARFMSTAAHQLKSPLAAIETMAALIRDGFVRDDAALHTVQSIVRRCRDAINGVGELLTLARVQQADPQRHGATQSAVSAVLRSVCAPREAEARRKGLTFTLELPAEDPLAVHVDTRDLSDCIDNLIENAIKYTAGPGAVRVSAQRLSPAAGARVARECIEVDVTDSGMGIAEVDLGGPESRTIRSPIFEPYRRGNDAIESGITGSGLGLSIVREVVEQAMGEIELRSQVGSGTTFKLRFPAVSADRGAREHAMAGPEAGIIGAAALALPALGG